MSLNWRQEQFCRYYVQIGILAEAYRRAGYQSRGEATYPAACQVFRSIKVKERIKELEAQAIAASDLTKERLLGWCVDIANRAKSEGNLSVEGVMLERLLKATGNLVDKREDVTRVSDTALLEQLQELLAPLLIT